MQNCPSKQDNLKVVIVAIIEFLTVLTEIIKMGLIKKIYFLMEKIQQSHAITDDHFNHDEIQFLTVYYHKYHVL